MFRPSSYSNEREVILDIVKYYRSGGCYAISNVSVSKLYGWGVFERPKYLEEHPMQPDIDVLWYDPKEDSLNGVEVKYFRVTSKMERTLQPKSYYAGLDEAIALLNFGVDKAWLFHVFDRNVPVNLALNYTKYMKKLAEMTMIGYISVIGETAELQSPPAANPLLEEEEFQKLRKIS